VAIIWSSYKEILGVSNQLVMSLNLNSMVRRHNLDHLDGPFTNEETMAVIKDMPTERAPGPDGFNGCFTKNIRTQLSSISSS
jgi:hypothetical protein